MADKDQKHNGNGSSRTEGGYSTHDAVESWRGFYQQMATEGMEFFQKGMEASQKMMPLYPGTEVFKQWVENYQDFVGRVGVDSSENPADMNTYKRMYDAWLDTWTRNLETYMRTPEFAAKSGKDLEALSEMKMKMGEMMEGYWHSLHLPSSQDMRELYHKLYTIERKLDELDRRFREFEASSKSSASAKKPTK